MVYVFHWATVTINSNAARTRFVWNDQVVKIRASWYLSVFVKMDIMLVSIPLTNLAAVIVGKAHLSSLSLFFAVMIALSVGISQQILLIRGLFLDYKYIHVINMLYNAKFKMRVLQFHNYEEKISIILANNFRCINCSSHSVFLEI